MSVIFMSVLTGWIVCVGASLAADDPTKVKLQKLKNEYKQVLEVTRSAAMETLEKLEGKARKRGDLAAVKSIRVEKELLEKTRKIPRKVLTSTQIKKLSRPRDLLIKGYAEAVSDYTGQGDIEEAERTEEKRKALLTDRVFVPEPPPGAAQFKGKSYMAFSERCSWHEARDRCERLGGRLAMVKDEETNKFVTELLQKQGLNETWLGATDEKREGEWILLDGSRMTFGAWGGSQPTNRSTSGEPEHYLVLIARTGQWNDCPAKGEKNGPPGFVCEW